MERNLKLCIYCNKPQVIFKNAEQGKQCLFCYNKERNMAGKKRRNTQRKIKRGRGAMIDELDRKFALIVKRRNIISDAEFPLKCYTCDTPLPLNRAQCGHFQPRSNFNTRWLLDNCRVQCKHCNEELRGNLVEFEKRLEQESPGVADKLRILARIPFKPSHTDMSEMSTRMSDDIREFMRIVKESFK